MLNKICDFCYQTKTRGHRCPYMKVGLTKDQCIKFKSLLDEKDKEIKALRSYIEGLTIYFKQAQDIGQHIHNIIIPLIKPIQPMTLDKYVDLSTIKPHDRKYLKGLFKRYIDYCTKDLNYTDFQTIDGYPLDLNLDI